MKKPSEAGNDAVVCSHTPLTLPVSFSRCAAALFVAETAPFNLPFPLSVDVCATLMVTCLCLASLRVNISTDSTHTSICINHSFF